MGSPAVTVLLRVYNGQRYLGEAVESILSQRFTDFELLVINDGSTDGTAVMLERYVADTRMRVLYQPNRGLSVSAKRGVEEARGKYIAIMDADDRSRFDRLEKQILFLESNSDHVVVGTAMRIIDENGNPIGYRSYPLSDGAIRSATMLYSPFGHSSICFHKTAALACGNYSEEFKGAEDFDFNVRLRMLGKGANLPGPLTDYRIHEAQFKTQNLRSQLSDTIRLRTIIHSRYGYHHDARSRAIDLFQRVLLFAPPTVVRSVFKLAFYRSSLPEFV